MERKRAMAVAGAVTAAAVAAVVAMGVNVGLFGLTGRADKVGTLRPVDVSGIPLLAANPRPGATPPAAPSPGTSLAGIPADPADQVQPGGTDQGTVVPGVLAGSPATSGDHSNRERVEHQVGGDADD